MPGRMRWRRIPGGKMKAVGDRSIRWRSQFPLTFKVPRSIEMLVEAGIIDDLSWGNDTSPSFGMIHPRGPELRLWVEHPLSAAREGASTRYGLEERSGSNLEQYDVVQEGSNLPSILLDLLHRLATYGAATLEGDERYPVIAQAYRDVVLDQAYEVLYAAAVEAMTYTGHDPDRTVIEAREPLVVRRLNNAVFSSPDWRISPDAMLSSAKSAARDIAGEEAVIAFSELTTDDEEADWFLENVKKLVRGT